MSDIPSRLSRIEEQTKYIKHTVDELSGLFKEQARNYHATELKLAKVEGNIERMDSKLESLETKIDIKNNIGSGKPQFSNTSVAAAAAFIAAVLGAVWEYFKP